MTLDTRNGRIGLGLIVVGGLLLIGSLFGWDFGAALWPLFILAPGLAFLAVAAFGGTAVSGLFIPGTVVTTLGLIFVFQNATDHFESWAYAWALLWAAVGVGLMLQGERQNKPQLMGQGRRLAAIAGAVFAVGLVFFEGFVFGELAGTWLFRVGLPVVLIGAGAWLLLRREFGSGQR